MSDRFEILPTPLADLQVLQRKPIEDNRGYLERMYCIEELQALMPGQQIAQINHTRTLNKGAVRGMHYQNSPHSEIKLVSCLKGEVFDVAVDVRTDSPTFLKWYGIRLSADNHKTFLIKQGFAHGFQALTDDCELLYFHTAVYTPLAEGALHVEDPLLNIQWPLPVAELSKRDAAHPFLDGEFKGIRI